MKNFEDFQKSQEYFLWEKMYNYINQNGLTQSELASTQDITDFWEPYLELIFKLGVVYKQTGKFKELKVQWMRPIFIIGNENTFKVDDKVYEPPNGAVYNGQELNRKLSNFSELIERFPKLDSTTWKSYRKDFQKGSGEMWKAIIKFVTKLGFRELNEVLKWILSPLLVLINASLHLFKIERQEAGIGDFLIFNNRADCITFTNHVKQNFKPLEDKKLQKDMPIEELEKYLDKVMNQDQYEYIYRDEFEMTETTKKDVDIMYYKFQKDALQEEFEKGMTLIFKYFNEKLESDFYDVPDVRKLFVNQVVKDHNKRKSLFYYTDFMNMGIFKLKRMLYEMKLNGMSRIKVPIRENKEFREHFKELFDLYHKIERLFGNYLSYDQYLFFYESLFILVNSNLNIKNEIELLKNRNMMEDCLPKYIVLQAMRKAVKVEERIRANLKEQNLLFYRKDYFQISQYELDNLYVDYIYSYDVKRNPTYGSSICEELDKTKKLIEEDIIRHEGRYWILEGFFDTKQKDEWIEAIEVLRNISDLVQDDIRDFILHGNKNEDGGKNRDRRESHRSGSKKGFSSSNSIQKVIKDRGTSGKGKKKDPKKIMTKKQDTNHSIESDDDSQVNKKTDLKSEYLRPPNVWNFPLEDLKYLNFMKSKNKEDKFLDESMPNADIRKVDPRDFYKDGRVRTFISMLEKLTESMLSYSKTQKCDIFKFFLENTLNALDIFYYNQKVNQ